MDRAEGWGPSNEAANSDFLSTVMGNWNSPTALDQLERNFSDAVKTVEATTGPLRHWQTRKDVNQPWREARVAVARVGPEVKAQDVFKMRKARRIQKQQHE